MEEGGSKCGLLLFDASTCHEDSPRGVVGKKRGSHLRVDGRLLSQDRCLVLFLPWLNGVEGRVMLLRGGG